MIELDGRVVVLAALAGIATLIAPLALGGWLVGPAVAVAVLTSWSVLRGSENDVTTAIVAGGLLTLVALSRGHLAAMACCAGAFTGAEIAGLARRFGVDHDAPTGPDVAATGTTIGIGVAAGATVAIVGTMRASPLVANAALVGAIVVGVVLLAVNHLHTRE